MDGRTGEKPIDDSMALTERQSTRVGEDGVHRRRLRYTTLSYVRTEPLSHLGIVCARDETTPVLRRTFDG